MVASTALDFSIPVLKYFLLKFVAILYIIWHWIIDKRNLQGPMFKSFLRPYVTTFCNKLECLSLASLSSLV